MNERTITYARAVNEALALELERDPDVILMGEDIGRGGGVYTVTTGLFDRFGEDRVYDTPIAEAGFVGLASGAAACGLRPVVELMFMDFALVAADQLFNQIPKMSFLSGGKIKQPLTIRTQQGILNGAAQHSQSLEALFAHLPGFAVALPSTPADAKGLLSTAIRMDEPVVFVEHKGLYFTRGEVPEGEHLVPFGKAAVRREGSDVTIVSYSRMVHTALAAADLLAAEGVSAEVIDLRTIVPLDMDTVAASVARTGHAVVAHEAVRTGGFGAELAARITERCWDSLERPVARIGGLSAPVPYAMSLEKEWLPQPEHIAKAALRLKRNAVDA